MLRQCHDRMCRGRNGVTLSAIEFAIVTLLTVPIPRYPEWARFTLLATKISARVESLGRKRCGLAGNEVFQLLFLGKQGWPVGSY